MSNLEHHICPTCGIEYAAPAEFFRSKNENNDPDNNSWHCPNGHIVVFTESLADKLRRENQRLAQRIAMKDDQVAAARDDADAADRRAAAFKGQVTKIKKRAAAGVCPCCNRQFQNLHRHMETKHPSFIEETKDNVETVRSKRLEKGYTQARLAKIIGVHPSHISKVERGFEPPKYAEKKIAAWASG